MKRDPWQILRVILATLLIGGAIVLQVGWGNYDVPALAFVVGVTLVATWLAHGLRAIGWALLLCLGIIGVEEPHRLRESVAVLGAASRFAWAAGVVGLLAVAIKGLSTLDDPSRLGPSIALPLCYLLYAAVLAELILQPLRRRLQTQFDRMAAPTLHCLNCHYDLRGTAGVTCPECGEPIRGHVGSDQA